MFESVVVPIYIYTCILFPWHSLRFYISRCPALALVINCFSIFFFFSVPRERRPSGGNYLSILLERSFPFRREICRYSHLREIRLVSWISRIQCKNYSKLFIYISKRRFEEYSLVISSISTLTVIWSRVSVARRLNFRRTFIAARIRFDL